MRRTSFCSLGLREPIARSGASDQSDPLIQEALAQMMNSSSSNTAGQAADTKEDVKPADDEEGEGADK